MGLRAISKWVAVTFGGMVVTPFLQAPATKLAESLHFDTTLSDRWGPLVQWLSDLAINPWYIAFASAVVGFAGGMWVDGALRVRERPAEEPTPDLAAIIELGRECIAIADETYRTQQQIEDAAPKRPSPEGGYRDQDHWNRIQFDHSKEHHEYGVRSMLRRDRAHGADLVDVVFRLRDAGLTIPKFADDFPGATDEMIAVLLPHYLTAYARFVGAMGRMLKRGDLKGAIKASRDYRRVTERGDGGAAQAAFNPPGTAA